MRPWLLGCGVVLLLAAMLGFVSALVEAPACAPHGPARLLGAPARGEGACARAEQDAAAATALAALGVLAFLLGATIPGKAPAPTAEACGACGRRVTAAHGFCPACGAAR